MYERHFTLDHKLKLVWIPGHVSGASLWDKCSCLLLSEVVSIGISRIEFTPDNLIIGI